MKYLCQCLICSLSILWPALFDPASANAGIIFQFADSNGTPVNHFHFDVSQTIDLRVYLVETGGTNFLDDGLFGASVQLSFGSTPNVVGINSIADIMPNIGFSDQLPPPELSATSAGFTGSVGLDPFLMPDADHRILLGTFRVTALSVGTTQFVVADRDLFSDDFLTGMGVVLDGLIQPEVASVNVNASAVPEPPSGIMLAFTCLFFAAKFRNNRSLTFGRADLAGSISVGRFSRKLPG